MLQVVCTTISYCCPSVCPAACHVLWAVQSLCCWLRHGRAENYQGWQSQHIQVVQRTDTGPCCSALVPVTVGRGSEVVTHCLDLVSRHWACPYPARLEQLCNTGKRFTSSTHRGLQQLRHRSGRGALCSVSCLLGGSAQDVVQPILPCWGDLRVLNWGV